MLFCCDLAVELLCVALFLLKQGVPPGFKFAKAAIEAPRQAAVEPDRAARQVLQESAVVAYEHESGTQLRQFAFQPFDGGKIEVVGRLIQQKNIWFRRQRPRERRAARLAARQRFRRLGSRQSQGIEQVVGAVISVVWSKAGHDKRIDIGKSRKIRFLRKIAHGGVGLKKSRAAVCLDISGRDFQQGRFS